MCTLLFKALEEDGDNEGNDEKNLDADDAEEREEEEEAARKRKRRKLSELNMPTKIAPIPNYSSFFIFSPTNKYAFFMNDGIMHQICAVS